MTTKNTKSNKPAPITVEVTALDIKRGVKNDTDKCAIARALKRLGFKNVEVGIEGELEMTKGTGKRSTRLFALLPKRAIKFIKKFDDCVTTEGLKPFTFTIRNAGAV